MPPPLLDHDAGFLQGVEHLAVEEFIAQLRVEALAIPVLPRTARFDVGGRRSNRRDPVLYCLGNELRPVAHREDGSTALERRVKPCGAQRAALGGHGRSAGL